MAFTPSRMNANHRLTPRASPRTRSPLRKSTNKLTREVQCLSIQKVIGTTSATSNSFDYLDEQRTFAYVAGAAVVVAKVYEAFKIEQRVFRARPGSYAPFQPATSYESPSSSSTALSLKGRYGSSIREGSVGHVSLGTTGSDGLDSPTSRPHQIRDRMKAASSISLSLDGSMLAVGETGYKPRVLLFSLTSDVPSDMPFAAIAEHSFGVQCVAFSLDSKYLASLGDLNDGFLYIWHTNRRNRTMSFHASNRCTSSVKQIFWVGESLVTIGVRHVKIWRVDRSHKQSPTKRSSDVISSPASNSKALSGRNCLLGTLLDKVFVAGIAISQTQAIVCSEDGSICLMDDNDTSPSFYKVAEAGFRVNAITRRSHDSVLVGGENGEIRHFTVEHLCKVTSTSVMLAATEERSIRSVAATANIIALASVGGRVLTLDSEREMCLLNLELDKDQTLYQWSIASHIPGHKSAVIGVHAITLQHQRDTAFFTFSADGSVSFWDRQGACTQTLAISLPQVAQRWDGFVNQLTAARVLSDGTTFVSGDKLGTLRATDLGSGLTKFSTNAHTSEISDIASTDAAGSQLVASAGRDRMIQVYRAETEGLRLVQTLDEHVGAVSSIMFSQDGTFLVSASSDRSIIIRKLCTVELDGASKGLYLMLRSIALKATPLSIDLKADAKAEIAVSTIDKQISRYSLDTGNYLGGFRTADQEDGDSVVINSITRFTEAPNYTYFGGLSSTDKSLRIYTKSGRLVGRDYGHTEGMTGLALLEAETGSETRDLVTAASDGTVFIWSVQCGFDQGDDASESPSYLHQGSSSCVTDLPQRPPLRKVISTSELSQIRLAEGDEDVGPLPIRARSRSPHRKKTPRLSTTPSNHFDPSTFNSSNRRHTESASSHSSAAELSARKPPQARQSSPSTPKTGNEHATRSSKSRPRQSSAHPPQTNTSTSASPNQSPGQREGQASHVAKLCTDLRAFRKNLSTSFEPLQNEELSSLERELNSTLRALTMTASKTDTTNSRNGRRLSRIREQDTAMANLLDAHADKLMHTIESKIKGCVSSEVEKRFGSDAVTRDPG